MDRLKTAYRLMSTEINGITECYGDKLSTQAQSYVYGLEKAKEIIREVMEQEKSPTAATEGQK